MHSDVVGATVNPAGHDGDVDVTDLLIMFSAFTGPAPDGESGLAAAEAADPSVPDLIYNPVTGEVVLDVDGSGIIGYVLKNGDGTFIAGNHTTILGGVSTSLGNELSEAAFASADGSIGFVFPAGMDLATLTGYLTTNEVSTSLGAPVVPFDLVVLGPAVPEPSTYALAAIGLVVLGVMGWRRKRAGKGMATALSVVVALVLLAENQASAVPIQWTVGSGGNDHWYEAFSATDITWEEANTEATNLGGYLVTITSEAENDFVFAQIDFPEFWYSCGGDGCYRGPWIGGVLSAGAGSPPDPLDDWEWVTGEAFTFENWRAGEPAGSPAGEDRIHFADYPALTRSATWNDLPETNVLNGYVVEFVPEPSTYALAAIGLLGLLAYRRFR